MKKLFTGVLCAVVALSLSNCSLGSTSNSGIGSSLAASATNALIGSLAGGNQSNAASMGAGLAQTGISLLSNLLGSGKLSEKSLVGTWTYAQPEVTLESESVLGKLGGELMANTIESKLDEMLSKIGLKKGFTTFTFTKDGKVNISVNGKTTTGTYTLNGNQLQMKGALGLASLNCTCTISANQLYMLFNANSIFSVITKMGTNVSSLSGLLKNFNGMKMGWSLTR